MVMVNMFVLTGPPGCQPFCERVQISCMDLIIQKNRKRKGTTQNQLNEQTIWQRIDKNR